MLQFVSQPACFCLWISTEAISNSWTINLVYTLDSPGRFPDQWFVINMHHVVHWIQIWELHPDISQMCLFIAFNGISQCQEILFFCCTLFGLWQMHAFLLLIPACGKGPAALRGLLRVSGWQPPPDYERKLSLLNSKWSCQPSASEREAYQFEPLTIVLR